MKVLLSAYSCEPNKGSEPGIGWRWALEVARMGHEVRVLTRAYNRASIEQELIQASFVSNIKFFYYDQPLLSGWLRKGNRGSYLYYFIWQWGAYRLARKVHKKEKFDQVHHVTFGSIRLPSFMGNLGIPFIFGPVAGGERAPWRLRMGYGWRGWIKDGLRDLSNLLIRIDPMVRRTFRQAERIYVTSKETLSLLPRKYRQKGIVQLAIGFHSSELTAAPEQYSPGPITNSSFKVLYVGRVLFWKGMCLGLAAFARLIEKRPDAQLTIVGSGPDQQRWRALAKNLGVGERVEWLHWVDRKELPALYVAHDVFLFPSLHDSGGMVVLEAMSYGLPIVCLDLGGAGANG